MSASPPWTNEPVLLQQVPHSTYGGQLKLGRFVEQPYSELAWPPGRIPTSRIQNCCDDRVRRPPLVRMRLSTPRSKSRWAVFLVSRQPFVCGLPTYSAPPTHVRDGFLPLQALRDQLNPLIHCLCFFPGQPTPPLQHESVTHVSGLSVTYVTGLYRGTADHDAVE